MNRLPIVISMLMLAVTALVTGCHRAPHYDSRLVAADSLMLTMPDSALVLVEAVTPDSLATIADQAYRDLLLTQVRYKCYQDITAGDDSAINRTLAYYRSHSGEREKLTRAYLYKGGVMEELGRPDSAMFYFKTAEANADEKDYANLGQINTRIADLYRIHNGNAQTCFEKYQLAYKYFTLDGNKKMQLNSLYTMYMMNGITQLNKQDTIFSRAITLAKELADDKKAFLLYELKCRQLSLNDTTCQEAKTIALRCLDNYSQFINNDLLLDFAYLYAKENKLDSAEFFLQNVDTSSSPGDEVHVLLRKHEILALIAESRGNVSLSQQHIAKSSHITDSIIDNTDKYGIDNIEKLFNDHKQRDNQFRISHLKYGIIGLSFLAILIIVVLTSIYLRRLHKSRAIINELRHTNINRHETLLEQLDVKDSVIERFVTNLVDFMQQAIETTENDSPTVIRKRIKECISDITDDKFWNELQAHIDRHHNNLISNFARQRRITPSDTRFIALSCCGFDYVEMAIVMDYTPKYISQKRKEIARKLHLRIPLQEYLDKAMRQQ